MEYHKYLKYKNKYLQLKKKSLQLGGALFYHDRKNDGNTEYTRLSYFVDGKIVEGAPWVLSLPKNEEVDIKEMREDTESGDWFGEVNQGSFHGWVNMKYLHQSPQDDRSIATKVAMFAAKGAKAAVGAVANVVYSGVMALDRVVREKSIKAVGRVVWDALRDELIKESPTFKLRDTVSVSGNIYMNSKDELPNSETDSLNFVNNKLGVIVSITDHLYNLKFVDDTFGVGILPFQLTKPGNSPTLKQLELQERLRVLQQQQLQEQDRQLELQLEQLEQRLQQEKLKKQKQQKLQKLQQEFDEFQQQDH
jgi:hypothetical protein